MRATEIFHRSDDPGFVRTFSDRLLDDDRVDQVIWRESRDDGADEFHVTTSDRGRLRFRRAHPDAHAPEDEYGGRWDLHGETGALDVTVNGRTIQYGAYPNALERIAGGVEFPRVGRVWVTARPRYEFAATGQSVHHDAGSHGTLHELDSRVPLLVSGAARAQPVTPTLRIVDVVPICCRLLDVPCGEAVAAAR